MKSQPGIGRPRISITRACEPATRPAESVGSTRSHEAASPARGDRHVAVHEEGEAAEHLHLAEPGLVTDQFANAVRKRLVVGHRP